MESGERISTHWESCWRAHLPCAVAEIERLLRVVDLHEEIERLKAEVKG